MENGLRPALPGGSLSSPVCGSLTEARPSGISAGYIAVRGDRGKSGFDYGLRKDVIQLEQRMAELAAADAARTKKHHERHAAVPEH